MSHHLAAVLAGARAHVDDPVRRPHHRLVVLDDDHRVAQVAQTLQRADQPFVVRWMQSDRRLVADVEHAHQAGPDLGGQPDPLRLATGERGRPAVQREVVEPDLDHEVEAPADLLQDLARDHLLAIAKRGLGAGQPRRPLLRFDDAHARHVDHVELVDRHRPGLRLQPRSFAGRAGVCGHVAFDLVAHVVGVGLLVAALQVRDAALECCVPLVLVPAGARVGQRDRRLIAVEHQVEVLLRQLGHGRRERKAVLLSERLEYALVPRACGRLAPPGLDGAVGQAQVRVRDHQLRIDLTLHAQAGAGRASAMGAVEAEVAGRDLAQAEAAVYAGELLGVELLFPGGLLRLALHRDEDDASAQL